MSLGWNAGRRLCLVEALPYPCFPRCFLCVGLVCPDSYCSRHYSFSFSLKYLFFRACVCVGVCRYVKITCTLPVLDALMTRHFRPVHVMKFKFRSRSFQGFSGSSFLSGIVPPNEIHRRIFHFRWFNHQCIRLWS